MAITLITFLISSWSIAGIISLQHQYTHKVALPFESFDFLYDKPWQRVGAYIVGKHQDYHLHLPAALSSMITNLFRSISFRHVRRLRLV